MTSSSTLSTLLKPLLEVTSDRLVHTDGQERLEYWTAFQKLWEIYPENDVPYGDVFNRYLIGNILFLVTRAMERAAGREVPSVSFLDGAFPDAPLVQWSSDDWILFSSYLKAAADSLKRIDATADVSRGDAENSKPDLERVLSPTLNAKVDKILRYIKVYTITAPIRNLLLKQLEDKKRRDDELPKLPKKKIAQVWSYCINEEDGVVQDQFFRKIFEKGEDDETPPPLKTIGELRDAFSDKPFNFDRFDDRIDLLMGEWCAECFNEPRLAPFYFPDHPEQVPTETESATGAANSPQNRIEVMNDLRTKRRNLRNTGEDPLQDSLRLAGLLSGQLTVAAAAAAAAASAAATTSRDPPDSRRASSLYRQKRSATQLQFDDDDEEEEIESDDPNGDGGTHQLSSLPVRGALNITEGEEGGDDTPRRSKKRKSQQKKYEGKRPWHEEEKTAIIEGIRRHGKGNWAEIKKDYDVLFAMRTSGQIKDCFRRMYDKGEIPKDLLLTVAADKGGDGGGTPDKENTPA